MGLYDKFINTIKTIDKVVNKPTQPKAKPGLKEYTFTLKEHFKGFKNFPIVVYSSKNKEAMINNNRLSDPLPGKEIKPYPSEFDKSRNAQRIKLFVKLINN